MIEKKTIRILAREANLKRRLRRHLSMVGFTKAPDGSLEISGSGKDVILLLGSCAAKRAAARQPQVHFRTTSSSYPTFRIGNRHRTKVRDAGA